VSKEIPVTAALCQLLESSFPEEYEARRQEDRALFGGSEGEEQPLPLFVMSSIFPGTALFSSSMNSSWPVLKRKVKHGSKMGCRMTF
jgi:hypothetical protein